MKINCSILFLWTLLSPLANASELKCETKADAANQIGRLTSTTKNGSQGLLQFLSYQIIDKNTGFEYTKPVQFRFIGIKQDASFTRISAARVISDRKNSGSPSGAIRFQSLRLSVNNLTGEASYLFDEGPPSKIQCQPRALR